MDELIEEASAKVGVTDRDLDMIKREKAREKRRGMTARPLSLAVSFLIGLGLGALWFARPMGPTYPYCIGVSGAISMMSRPQLWLARIALAVVGFIASYYVLAPYVFWETHERVEFFGASPEYGVFVGPDIHTPHAASRRLT